MRLNSHKYSKYLSLSYHEALLLICSFYVYLQFTPYSHLVQNTIIPLFLVRISFIQKTRIYCVLIAILLVLLQLLKFNENTYKGFVYIQLVLYNSFTVFLYLELFFSNFTIRRKIILFIFALTILNIVVRKLLHSFYSIPFNYNFNCILLISVILLKSRKKGINIYFSIILLSLAYYIETRGSMLVLLIFCFINIICVLIKKDFLNKYFYVFAMSFTLFVIPITICYLSLVLLDEENSRFAFSFIGKDGSLGGREFAYFYYYEYLQNLSENLYFSLLTGFGAQSYIIFKDGIHETIYSSVLQYILQYGVIITIIFFAMFFYRLKKCNSNNIKNLLQISSMVIVFSLSYSFLSLSHIPTSIILMLSIFNKN